MAKITAPVKGFTGKVVGVMFDGGVATVEDERQLAYFRRHGYTVEEAEATKPDGPKYPEGQEPAEGWTVAQLTAWAGDHDVDVPAGPKPAVVEAVMKALAERKAKAEADAEAAAKAKADAENTPPVQ